MGVCHLMLLLVEGREQYSASITIQCSRHCFILVSISDLFGDSLTHANLRKYSPAMWDDEGLRHVRLSIESAVCHGPVWSVRVLKSFRPSFFRSFQLPHCKRSQNLVFLFVFEFYLLFYLILFSAFSFSVIRRSNASSLASASFSLRSTSPALWNQLNGILMKCKRISKTIDWFCWITS